MAGVGTRVCGSGCVGNSVKVTGSNKCHSGCPPTRLTHIVNTPKEKLLCKKLSQRPQFQRHFNQARPTANSSWSKSCCKELSIHPHLPSHLCLPEKLNQRPQLQLYAKQALPSSIETLLPTCFSSTGLPVPPSAAQSEAPAPAPWVSIGQQGAAALHR